MGHLTPPLPLYPPCRVLMPGVDPDRSADVAVRPFHPKLLTLLKGFNVSRLVGSPGVPLPSPCRLCCCVGCGALKGPACRLPLVPWGGLAVCRGAWWNQAGHGRQTWPDPACLPAGRHQQPACSRPSAGSALPVVSSGSDLSTCGALWVLGSPIRLMDWMSTEPPLLPHPHPSPSPWTCRPFGSWTG